jgi:competence protein ComEC
MLLIVLCSAALCGLLAGDLLGPRLAPASLIAAAVGGALAALLVRSHPPWRLLALAACVAGLAALRAVLTFTPSEDPVLASYLGLPVTIDGRVVDGPSFGPRSTRVLVAASAIGSAGGEPRQTAANSARVVVIGEPHNEVLEAANVDDRLRVEGTLTARDSGQPPVVLFPSRLSLEAWRPGPLEAPMAWLGRLRTSGMHTIQRALPEPQGSLAAGVLLGGPGKLDADFRLALQRSGLAHLVAIDGYKQIVVAAALRGLVLPVLGTRRATLVVLLGLLGYTLVTGAHPSAVRAGLMVGLASFAPLVGYVSDSLTSLLFAATLMGLAQPGVLLEVSFQLSVSATAGLVLLWPRLRRRLRRVPAWIAEPAGLTLAVSISTLPVVLGTFQSLSLVSPLAHVLAVPLLPFMLVSAAALLVPLPPALEPLTAWPAWLASTLLAEVVRWTGSLPAAAISTGRLPTSSAVMMAGALIAAAVWRDRTLNPIGRVRLRRPVILSGLAAFTSLLAVHVLQPDGQLHVEPLAAGRGTAVFVRGPTGQTMLVIDGRVDDYALTAAVSRQLNLWEHDIGTLVVLGATTQADAASASPANNLLPSLNARYPPRKRLDDSQDARLDLGGGAVLDLYAGQPLETRLSFGGASLRVIGDVDEPLALADESRR